MHPNDAQLWLCFDGGNPPDGNAAWASPDTVIVYEIVAHKLLREDQNAGTTFVAARDIDAMSITGVGGNLQIQLTFTYRNLTRTCTMIAKSP
jgi:hypothetical protein